MSNWNPWHGCKKCSTGCLHCYVYRGDSRYQRDSSVISKNKSFDLPLRKDRTGNYKLQPDSTVYTCFTSDFLLEEADPWRNEAWNMIRQRSDLFFYFITKRIHRLKDCVPDDWGKGYKNVGIGCTVENQNRADFRLPIFLDAPVRHKDIVCSPLLEDIDLTPYLTPEIRQVTAAGESGNGARLCKFDWILHIKRDCDEHNIPFFFQQTGANFEKDGKRYQIPRKLQHSQARRANLNTGFYD